MAGHQPGPGTVRTLSRQIHCSPLIARLLAIRGIQTNVQATRFLNPSLRRSYPAIGTGWHAGRGQANPPCSGDDEKILVFGDYDADGITATAALIAFLRRCGARVSYYIPHRIADGYGLGTDFINNRAIPAGMDLIITADCGSSSNEAITLPGGPASIPSSPTIIRLPTFPAMPSPWSIPNGWNASESYASGRRWRGLLPGHCPARPSEKKGFWKTVVNPI
jgi:hypothetical protein